MRIASAPPVYHWLIIALWLLLTAFWLITAGHAKPAVRSRLAWRRELGLRLAVLVLVVIALRLFVPHHALRNARLYAVNSNRFAGFAGLALCALGVSLAVWARVCLGRNWGMPMTRKANPELVTSGPYAVIRHPIYSGLILAMLGSTVGMSVLWAIPLVLVGGYFIHSARREEKLMSEQFPEMYPRYLKRTKMLMPFVW